MAIWEQPQILSGTDAVVGAGSVKPEIAIIILHTGHVTTQWAMRYKLMKFPHFIYLPMSNQPYDTSREMATRMALAHNVKYVFHLDSDLLCPINTVPILIQWMEELNLPVLSGLYWAKKPGPPMPAAWKIVNEVPEANRIEFMPLDIWPFLREEKKGRQGVVPVDVCGTGCMLIKADVFKKLDESDPNKPYFEWGLGRRDKEGKPLQQVSEDFYFCLRCIKELNIQPHLAVPVKCDHISTTVKRGADGNFDLLI